MTLNPVKRHHERCHEARARMSAYLDSEVDHDTAAVVERHARWCPNCHRMLRNLRRTLEGLRALAEQPTPADQPRE